MSKEQPRILLAGGGTGGHLFPALAIAEEIRRIQPDAQVRFVGTNGKIESRVVPQHGYPLDIIWISGFHRRLTIENLLFPVKVMVSLMQSSTLIRKFKPDVIVGTGGYVCGPVLYIGSKLGIPTVVHESNSYPGITTRMLANQATRVFTAFEATNRWLKRVDNVELVGTPIRNLRGASRKTALSFFDLEASRKTVLVVGGSHGATSMNTAMKSVLANPKCKGIQFLWQTGEKDFDGISKQFGRQKHTRIKPFIDRMDYAYAAADVIVSRAGATTIAEITALGKPAILVPYPHAAADHQTQNALTLVDGGAAIMIPDKDIHSQLVGVLLALLKDEQRRKQMAQASRALGRREAGTIIARKILDLVRN